MAHLFGGEKGIKKFAEVLVRYAAPCVGNGYLNTWLPCLIGQFAVSRGDRDRVSCFCRVQGVDQHVHEHALELVAVHVHHGEILPRHEFYAHPPHKGLVFHERYGGSHQSVDIDLLPIELGLSGEIQEPFDDLPYPVCCLGNGLKISPDIIGQIFTPQQHVSVSQNPG